MKKIRYGGIFLLIVISTACQFSVDMANSAQDTAQMPGATDTPVPALTDAPQPEVPDGWATYQNDQYGFELSYPPDFQLLQDADSLYGWPNAVALLYQGGQSYDIAIQVWDSQAELDANYPNEPRMQTFDANGKIISLFDVTQEADNAAVIATFRLLP